ncbi:hypothetical protein KL86DPRO_11338 [uncultured delta proteobacterium]|uniref:Uncharacterized protein n=1 Tax=uncultured delta proteobacterium TaxID=34034 RepID=A0A212JFD9_9DELT|nr:hypothetical protein KL86DPRO_11338 [uncultured delta proteobacterium]
MGRALTILFFIVILGGLLSKCSNPEGNKQSNLRSSIVEKYKLPAGTKIELGDMGSVPWIDRYDGGQLKYRDYVYARWLDPETGGYKSIRCGSGRYNKKDYVYGCEDKPFEPYRR